MQPGRRILVLKVILKSMLLFAVLWLLWVMLSSIPGAPKPRPHSGPAAPFTAPPFVAILPPGHAAGGADIPRETRLETLRMRRPRGAVTVRGKSAPALPGSGNGGFIRPATSA